MNYAEMIAGFKAAGRDVSGFVKHVPTPVTDAARTAANTMMSAVSIDAAASIIDEAVYAALAPLEQRLAKLEFTSTQSVGGPPPKPVVRIAAGRRQVVRIAAPTRRIVA